MQWLVTSHILWTGRLQEKRGGEEKNKSLGAHILTHLRFNSVCYSIITGKKGANKKPQSSTTLNFIVKQ